VAEGSTRSMTLATLTVQPLAMTVPARDGLRRARLREESGPTERFMARLR
jgi:hypothetical protein